MLAALLDGMDAALCAFDADGVVTHWNREAERILGWTADDAVGRKGLAGWAVRPADAEETEARLLGALGTSGREVHEAALLTKDGGRVLVRVQSAGVAGADGGAHGVYCAFSDIHAQTDLERSVALSEALLEDAPWGVVVVDADLRPVVANAHAVRAFRRTRTELLGQPLGELFGQGREELEGALQHVLAEGAPPAPAELWLTLPAADPSAEDPEAPRGRTGQPRGGEARRRGRSGARAGGQGAADEGPAPEGGRRCWRSGFLRLASPLSEEPVPLGVAWLFQDVTDAKQAEQETARLRFRDNQLHRAARAAAECEDPMEAATVHLDFALAGFADHALLDLTLPGAGASRLVRAVATPAAAPGAASPVTGSGVCGGIPVGYGQGHPALLAAERGTSVRSGASPGSGQEARTAPGWAAARKWPEGTVHGLCAVLRSRGRTLGVVTFLRGPARRPFDRRDTAYAEDVAVRVAAAVDLARAHPADRPDQR
ncbi:PAS domain-containing protein [Streptomyces sp. HNM0574]|uniref:PAS domain-containing protein n=1 Tax=Streptomyces sp. HNM0574 TaxID=2714954 RepID=UPI0023F66687|nr:PAS domain-containing protein [Streptomyces sp. HNM0574]